MVNVANICYIQQENYKQQTTIVHGKTQPHIITIWMEIKIMSARILPSGNYSSMWHDSLWIIHLLDCSMWLFVVLFSSFRSHYHYCFCFNVLFCFGFNVLFWFSLGTSGNAILHITVRNEYIFAYGHFVWREKRK